MPNISSIIKNVRNIMRQDRGVSGDAQRLEQLGWLLFLKILDDKDQELELIRDRYQSVIPEKFQWRNWATDAEGIKLKKQTCLFASFRASGWAGYS
jgi:type I restriction enzyme M protein